MDFWSDNKTKILGTATAVNSTLLSMIALGMFDAVPDDPGGALMAPHALRWLTIVLSVMNVALGGGTVAVGVQNTTAERIANARATVAQAQETTARQMAVAVNAPPGSPVPVVQHVEASKTE